MTELTGHFDGLGLTELCRVFAVDEPHPVNGAHHRYRLWRYVGELPAGTPVEVPPRMDAGHIRFQRGPRNTPGSTLGTLDGAVLEVLIHRMECFQRGPYACDANAEILGHLTAARELLKQRAQERAARGVLGKNEK